MNIADTLTASEAAVTPPAESPTASVAPLEAGPVMPSAKALAKARIKRAIKMVIAAGILAYLFSVVPFGDVWTQMKTAHPGWLLASFASAMMLQLAVADRLRRLIAAQGVELSTYDVFEINLSTLFYGLFLPGGNFTGIAIRFYRLSAANQNVMNTGVALFFDRLLATFCLLLMGIGFWCIAMPEEGWFALWAMVIASVGFAGLTLAVFAPPQTPVLGLMQKFMQRFGGKTVNKLREAMQAVWTLPRRALGLAFLLAMTSHLLGMVAYWCILRGMGLPVDFVTIAWVRSAMILATMIPLTPSGVGLREGATMMLLTSYGVGHDEALAFSLLVFGVTVLAVGLVGGVFEACRLLRQPKPQTAGRP